MLFIIVERTRHAVCYAYCVENISCHAITKFLCTNVFLFYYISQIIRLLAVLLLRITRTHFDEYNEYLLSYYYYIQESCGVTAKKYPNAPLLIKNKPVLEIFVSFFRHTSKTNWRLRKRAKDIAHRS